MELRLCLRNKELRPEPLQAQLLDSPKRAHLETSATFPTIHNKKHAVSLDILATREIFKLTELTPRGILLEGAGSPKEVRILMILYTLQPSVASGTIS